MSDDLELLKRGLSQRYRILRELGRGGMATVYLADDLKHDRQVAIKILLPEVAAEIGQERFRREIAIAARMTHPHILPLHDSGAVEGRLYYVMPYIEGETLRARIDREKRLSIEDAVRLTREIAGALGHAHRQGLVHRDVKPENILLAEGIPLVADFGIARATSPESTVWKTAAGAVVGTPAYMAPEQLIGSEVDGRADLYSLGCVLHEMLTGTPPFDGPWESLALQHLSAAPPLVSESRPDTPIEVARAIAKVLAKSPGERFASAAAFAEALGMAMLDAAVPPPQPSGDGSRHLPRERTRFIGREDDLREGARILAEHRLLTVTGVGGGGKTRLAIKLAERLGDRFLDGAWFVDLGPLAEPRHVIEAVAQAVGVREEADRPLAETLGAHLETRQLLIVLDNCEHLLEACASLVDACLKRSEGVRIVATSREPLGVDGERVFALRTLSLPATEQGGDWRATAASEAVKLFVDRARLGMAEFSVDAGNAEAVSEICRRLDGIPLAIELAAARVRLLSVEQIRSRLDDRFRLLTGGARVGLPRQQTLKATIQWSYDQLTLDEQRLLRALSVFAGGWTLAAAARIGDAADEFHVLELLGRLVDKSLVIVERITGAEPRYSLLETVRRFGQELLNQENESEAVRSRHLGFFLALAERAYQERLVREEAWGEAFERDHGNLRAALEFAREHEPERYLELAGALGWFWQARSHALEGRDDLMAALAATPANPVRSARARATWGLANILTWQSATEARQHMEEALQSWRVLGDSLEIAMALEGVGWARLLGGEDEAACASFEECLRLQTELGDPVLINRARVGLAQVLVALHQTDRATALSREILAFAESNEDRRSEHFGWHFLADCALIAGRCQESLALYGQSLTLVKAIGDRMEMGFEIQGAAMSLAGLGDGEMALRLEAAALAEFRRLGTDLHIRFWDDLRARYLDRARSAMEPSQATRADHEGAAMTFERAVAVVLEAARSRTGTDETIALDRTPID